MSIQRRTRALRDGITPEPGDPLPGFGHRVYARADPRYELEAARRPLSHQAGAALAGGWGIGLEPDPS